MKLLILVVLLFSAQSFAATKKCSNADGSLRFEYWQYEGGSLPPDDTPLAKTTYILNGQEMPEDAGSLQLLQTLEVQDLDYVEITKELVYIRIQTATQEVKDFATCTSVKPKIAMP